MNADANALYHKAYDTTGTDSRLPPSTLEQRHVIDLVDDNLNLNASDVTYEVLEDQGDGTWGPSTLGTDSILIENTLKPSGSLTEATSRNPLMKKYRKSSMISEPAGMRPLEGAKPPTGDRTLLDL